jgi:hypothetical protein
MRRLKARAVVTASAMLLGVGIAIVPPATAATEDYGAIAYSPVQGSIGFGVGSTDAEAQTQAIADCQAKGGSANCGVFTWFTNAWGALAEATNGHVGSGWGWDSAGSDQALQRAKDVAVSSCTAVGGTDCRVAFSRPAGNVQGPGTGSPDIPYRWSYAALGDSYSAGEGIDPPADPNPPSAQLKPPRLPCHRSPHAYPVQLHDQVATLGDLDFYACTGAVTDDFYTDGKNAGGEPNQLGRIEGNADSITLTIGGNDLGFADMLSDCVEVPVPGVSQNVNPDFSGPCSSVSGRPELGAVFALRLAKLDTGLDSGAFSTAPGGREIHKLSQLLVDIHTKAPKARIFLGGYPQLFGTDQANFPCSIGPIPKLAGQVGYVGYDDAQWLNGFAPQINKVLSDAVDAANATIKGGDTTKDNTAFFVAADGFNTHGLCDSGAPWITDYNTSSVPFHPTTEGQAQFAKNFRDKEGIPPELGVTN